MLVQGYGTAFTGAAEGEVLGTELAAGCGVGSAAAGVIVIENITSAMARKGKRRTVVLSGERLLYASRSLRGSHNPVAGDTERIKAKRQTANTDLRER
jgi:hypothetical protein